MKKPKKLYVAIDEDIESIRVTKRDVVYHVIRSVFTLHRPQPYVYSGLTFSSKAFAKRYLKAEEL